MTMEQDPVNQIPAASALRKSRFRWRVVAIIALIIAVIAAIGRFAGDEQVAGQDHIARINIDGTITTDNLRQQAFKAISEAGNVKALVIEINSPGGSTAGGEELYEAISDLRATMPVAVIINELGASAAYMTAIAGDRIFARRLSIVGSIGVFYAHVNVGKLMENIGVDFDKVQTGPLKAEPDMDEPLEGAPRASLQRLVDDSFEWFVDVVAERRDLTRAQTLALADGRILTGRMALEAGLIDEIGSMREARAWLAGEFGIDEDLPERLYYPIPEGDFERFAQYFGGKALSAIGLNPGGAIPLDGLVSVWQASPSN